MPVPSPELGQRRRSIEARIAAMKADLGEPISARRESGEKSKATVRCEVGGPEASRTP